MRQIVTQAGFTDQPLAELKSWLAITTTAEDAVLTALLETASVMCERFTGSFPLETGIGETLPASREWQALTACPFVALGAVVAVAGDGSEIALQPADYALERLGDGARIRLISARTERQLRVTYTAGLARDWSVLDSGLRHGIVRFAAHAYRERDRDGEGAVPAAVVALWRPWRRLRL